MLRVLFLFLLLIAGVVLGPMLAGHQGYVLIQTDNYNIETSVTGLAIILILAVRGAAVCDRVDPAPHFPHRRPHARLVCRPQAPPRAQANRSRRCSSWRKATISRLKS